MVKLQNVSFSYYKRNKILNKINFETESKGLYAIIGENGSGKSTLINLIHPQHSVLNSIFVNGKDVKTIKKAEFAKMVSFLPQKINFPEKTSVFDVLKIGRFPHTNFLGILGKKDKKIIKKYSKKLGVYDLYKKEYNELSGGQQQRILIAMCLIQETKIIILDEPTNHLDLKYQIEIFEILEELKNNKLLIIASHQINLVSKFSDKILMLKNGKVIGFGGTKIINKKNMKKLLGVNTTISKVNNKPHIIDFNSIKK